MRTVLPRQYRVALRPGLSWLLLPLALAMGPACGEGSPASEEPTEPESPDVTASTDPVPDAGEVSAVEVVEEPDAAEGAADVQGPEEDVGQPTSDVEPPDAAVPEADIALPPDDPCLSKACDDGDICNGYETCDAESGSCVAGQPLQCNDGIQCNGAETCDPDAGCTSPPPPLDCCSADTDCGTLEPCAEVGQCIKVGAALLGFCAYTPHPGCDDGAACNGLETCDGATGACVAGEPLEGCCTAQEDCEDGNPCNGIGNCDEDTKTCHVQAAPTCDDGNPCNGFDACFDGLGCAPVAGPLDCSDGNPCNGLEVCDPLIGCQPGEAKLCDDGNACNGLEGCDPAIGCLPGELSTCIDSNPCNGLETCDPLVGCLPGSVLVCSDDDLCNGQEACDATLGCVAGIAPACDDGDACNGPEDCSPTTGCLPGAPPACDDGDACNGLEACDPAVGCKNAPPPQCVDGDVCNGLETCDYLTGCVLGVPLDCGDGNPCNGQETCNPSSGCTSGEPVSCDDDNLCNGASTCDPASGCVDGIPLTCDDGNACNGQEACDQTVGCTNGDPLSCNDGNVCNGNELCDALAGCVGEAPLSCADDNLCNGVEICDPAIGCTGGTPVACSDGDACNGVETCDPSTGCQPSAPPSCDDLNPCNGIEACEPALGCQPGELLLCSDGNLCNGQEVCDYQQGCKPGLPLVCSDGDACNGTETCAPELGCVLGEAPVCDDGLTCTNDLCEAGAGCKSVPINACVIDGACHTPLSGSQDNPCVVCDPAQNPFGWSEANDGFVCGAVPFGALACDDGACVADCDVARGDCDGVQDNGCETDLLTSADHCGGCGEDCEPGFQCAGGLCVDLCVPPFVACDGLCVDTDASALHCGGCGQPCTTPDPLLVGACAESACTTSDCPEGVADANGDPVDGCEYPCTVTNEGVELCDGVDQDCDGLTDEDFDLFADPDHCGACGAKCAHPSAITWACSEAECLPKQCHVGLEDLDGLGDNGCEHTTLVEGEVWVDSLGGDDDDGEGTEASPFASIPRALAHIGAQAVKSDWFVHVLPGPYPGTVVVPASLEGLTIQGAGGEDSLLIAPGTSTALTVEASAATVRSLGITGGSRGVQISSADGVLIEDVAITGIAGLAEGATSTAGLFAQDSDDLTLRFVDVSDVAGTDKAASGLDLQGVLGVVVEHTEITDVHVNEPWQDATGLSIDGHGVVVRDVVVSSIKSNSGKAHGLRVEAGGPDVSAVDVLVEDVTIGAIIGGSKSYSDATGVHIYGVGSWASGGAEGAWTSRAELRRISVGSVIADNGSSSGGGPGAFGIRILSSAARLEAIDVLDVRSGAGDSGPGLASGIHIQSDGDVEVEGVQIRDVLLPGPGVGGKSFDPSPPDPFGFASGLFLGGGGPHHAAHILVGGVLGSGASQGGYSAGACVRTALWTSQSLQLRQLSCFAKGGVAEPVIGLHAANPGGDSGTVTLLDSILSVADSDGALCLQNDTPSPSGLTALNVTLHGCTIPPQNVLEMSGVTAGDPLFVDPAGGDLHLSPDSPAIDAGVSSGDYCGEPEPNGCRSNLGFYGNTEEATSAPGADHCPCE